MTTHIARYLYLTALSLAVCTTTAGAAGGRQAAGPPQEAPAGAPGGAPVKGAPLPAGYVIGADDVLTIVFWRDKDLTAEVRVRPDGMISLPLLNDVRAAGLTPEELRAQLAESAKRFVQEPNATVIVKEINSRQVFITGNVAKPGTYRLTTQMNVLQLLAQAGGLLEYADSKNIVVIRTEAGRQTHLKFNYKDVIKRKRPEQNIALKPGDTIVVP
jgi:polysaccharide export outer membrane protein